MIRTWPYDGIREITVDLVKRYRRQRWGRGEEVIHICVFVFLWALRWRDQTRRVKFTYHFISITVKVMRLGALVLGFRWCTVATKTLLSIEQNIKPQFRLGQPVVFSLISDILLHGQDTREDRILESTFGAIKWLACITVLHASITRQVETRMFGLPKLLHYCQQI